MTDSPSEILLFPKRPTSHNNQRAPSPLAEAEWRATMLGELLKELSGSNEFPLSPMQLRIVSYAAQEILEEMVVLYRRALSKRGPLQR